MHEVNVLLLDPESFKRRFRFESGGPIYDPSLGKASGRPISNKEAGEALQSFGALHAAQEKRIDRAAKFFIPSLFVVPTVLMGIGHSGWMLTAAAACICLLIGTILLANLRLHQFTSNLWKRFEPRPHSQRLSVQEQVALGYRQTWTDRATIVLGFVIFLPGYVYGHGKHDVLLLIPKIGETLSLAYWAGIKVLGGLLLFCLCAMIIKRITPWLAGRRKALKPKRRVVIGKSTATTRRASKSPIRPYGRGDLSGVDKMKRS